MVSFYYGLQIVIYCYIVLYVRRYNENHLINGSSTPLYEQIKNAIKENIVGNTVASDAQLPSVRQHPKN